MYKIFVKREIYNIYVYTKNNYNCDKRPIVVNNKSEIHFHKVWEILNFDFRKGFL